MNFQAQSEDSSLNNMIFFFPKPFAELIFIRVRKENRSLKAQHLLWNGIFIL